MRYALGRRLDWLRLDWLKPHCARCGLQRFGWRLPVALPGPAGPIGSGPARYERMLPAAARPAVARTVGAVVPDVRPTRAGQEMARLDLPPVSLASERRPSAPSAHVLPALVARRRPVRARSGAGGVAARGACGAPRGAAMCGAAGRAAGAACGAGAARGAAAGCGAGAGCPAGGAPGGFAVAEVAAMPAARTRSDALRMRDCNMIPAPASSFRVNVGTGWWLRVRRCRGSIASGQCDDHTFRIAACENEQIDMGLFQAGSRIWTASRLRSDSGISIKKLRGLPHPSRRMLRTFSECGRREFHRIISVPAPWSVRSSSSTACGTLPSRITTPSTPASSA